MNTAIYYALIDDVTPNRATVTALYDTEHDVRAAMLRVGCDAVARDRPMAIGERIWIGPQSIGTTEFRL